LTNLTYVHRFTTLPRTYTVPRFMFVVSKFVVGKFITGKFVGKFVGSR
jgi:hypothetical protein